jgi:hypothetical protein
MPSSHKSFIFGDTLRDQLMYIPKDDMLKFLDAIISYGLNGIDTYFEGKDMAIWHGMKALLDALNKKHWSSQLNGRLGRAPSGNQNATKQPKSTQNNLKQPTGYSDSDSDRNRNLGIGNSDDSDVGYPNDQNSPITQESSSFDLIKSKAKELGYILDSGIVTEILQSDILSDWFTGPYSVLELADLRVCEKYGNKSEPQKRLLFKNALCHWESIREEFPAWHEQKIAEAAAQAERQRQEAAAAEKHRLIEEARSNKPETCDHCGADLAPDSRDCPSCGWTCFFDEDSGAWEFQEQFSISDAFQAFMKKQSAVPAQSLRAGDG